MNIYVRNEDTERDDISIFSTSLFWCFLNNKFVTAIYFSI